MFDVEIKNLKILANIGITSEERKKKQLLKVSLNFSYSVAKGKDLEAMNNLKDYSKIAKSLKQFIAESSCDTLEKLITSSSHMLAKKFKIPEAVYRGIIEHHGDSVMRYFYEKEKQMNPDVSKDDFRHLGQKPSSRETVILMFADSLEAACRARFQYEDADEEKISNLVNEIFDEKINDGQLLDAPITFQDLETIKQSFQSSLEGLYHQRVLYPEFTDDEEE